MNLKIKDLEEVEKNSFSNRESLTDEEKEGIVLAVKSAFLKLKNLYEQIVPIFDEYGFKAPSAGVIARDLSEKIETSIIQHCRTFTKGIKFNDLARFNKRWEVKICKNAGLTINQSAIINKENYIVVNYKDNSTVHSIWILWETEDHFFSERKRNTNARALVKDSAKHKIEEIYSSRNKKIQ